VLFCDGKVLSSSAPNFCEVCGASATVEQDGRSKRFTFTARDLMLIRAEPPPWTVEDYNDACFIVKDRGSEEREQMAWFVHYWDEINNRNICSSEISAREDAMRKACSLMREGYVVSHVAGPNDERIDIVDIRAWCSAHASN
jgi:hypothetical protein